MLALFQINDFQQFQAQKRKADDEDDEGHTGKKGRAALDQEEDSTDDDMEEWDIPPPKDRSNVRRGKVQEQPLPQKPQPPKNPGAASRRGRR